MKADTKASGRPVTYGLIVIGILFLIMCCCFIFLLYLRGDQFTSSVPTLTPSVSTTPTSDPLYSFNCIRESGMNDLCLAGEGLVANRQLLEDAARGFCEDKPFEKNQGYCFVLIWKDLNRIPQALPMTDEELAAQIAQYNKNPSNGYDCFQTYENEKTIYSSSGCGK